MIHETLDINTEPLLTPEAVYGKHEKICDVCVITFSYKVMEWALQHLDCRQAAEIGCCNGNRPVSYGMERKKDCVLHDSDLRSGSSRLSGRGPLPDRM